MASRNAVIGLYQSILGRDPYASELAPGGYVDRYAHSGLGTDALTKQFQSSDEYRQRQSAGTGAPTPAQANGTATPNALPTPLNYDQINQQFDPIRQAAQDKFTAQSGLINQDYTDLSNRLKENAGYAQTQNLEGRNNLGLLQSGQTGQQQAYLNRDLSNQLNRGDIQRTMDQANLALQNAGFTNDLTSQVSQRGIAQQGLQQGQQTIGLNQAKGLTDLYSNPFILGSLPDSVRSHVFGQYGINYTS